MTFNACIFEFDRWFKAFVERVSFCPFLSPFAPVYIIEIIKQRRFIHSALAQFIHPFS